MTSRFFCTAFFTLTLVFSCITFTTSGHFRCNENFVCTSADTLKRTEFRYSVHDTAGIRIMRPAEADSFSVARFSSLKGITTFRGGPFRDNASVGVLKKRPQSMTIKWTYETHPKGEWGGGSGWTGQPGVVQWPDSIRDLMNLKPPFDAQPGFSEVIVGSLDGSIYFLDLESGKPSRSAINIGNPIKGSVTIDPRGYPILYCGQGIALKNEFGFRIFSLIDQSLLYFINGYDPFAPRGWAAFDGAALINPKNDRMYLGGENGLFYALKLNSTFSPALKSVTVHPQILKYRYSVGQNHQQGIENSLAAWRDKIFFADNNGYIQCLDISTFRPDWIQHNHDDTDASLVLDVQAQVPYLYTGCEVDKQGEKGSAYLRKINGITGATVWERAFECLTIRGDHPVNGGLLSTPVMGKMKAKDMVIFSLSRYNGMNKGLLVALNKATGETLYQVKLNNYTWSSPADIYDSDGNLYLFLADSKGYVMLYDGRDGTLIYQQKIADLFEASPVIFENKVVIPSRPAKIFCLEVN